jgi:uncharacterized protein
LKYLRIVVPVLFSICLIYGAACAQDQDLPVVHRHVNDLAGWITPAQADQLEETLTSFERETSNQIVVLIVKSLNGAALEDYSMRVAEKNNLGVHGRNNGALFLIIKEERRMRIEVGYGLEGALPDAVCDQIMRRVVGPKFRYGDYYGGIAAGCDAIMLATKGEFAGQPRENKPAPSGRFIAIIFLLFISGVFRLIFRGTRRLYVGPRGTWFGGFGGGGFGGGGFGGFGGGGGGGGFSGGGGSFGGGGASGSW